MAASKTLKKYIDEANIVIQSKDDSAARLKIKEILSVFSSEYSGLTSGLNSYNLAGLMLNSRGSTFDSREIDHIEDLRRLRNRLQMELDKIEEDIKATTSNSTRTKVFISHSSVDDTVAVMLKDFLVACGIDNNLIFCSSIPENGVKQKISWEIKEILQTAAVNIAILSSDYYESAFCLNEAGVIWYLDDVDSIVIAMPEINENCMPGFLGAEYKLRRLNAQSDLTGIYDIVHKALKSEEIESTTIISAIEKLIVKYKDYISNRGEKKEPNIVKDGQDHDLAIQMNMNDDCVAITVPGN